MKTKALLHKVILVVIIAAFAALAAAIAVYAIVTFHNNAYANDSLELTTPKSGDVVNVVVGSEIKFEDKGVCIPDKENSTQNDSGKASKIVSTDTLDGKIDAKETGEVDALYISAGETVSFKINVVDSFALDSNFEIYGASGDAKVIQIPVVDLTDDVDIKLLSDNLDGKTSNAKLVKVDTQENALQVQVEDFGTHKLTFCADDTENFDVKVEYSPYKISEKYLLTYKGQKTKLEIYGADEDDSIAQNVDKNDKAAEKAETNEGEAAKSGSANEDDSAAEAGSAAEDEAAAEGNKTAENNSVAEDEKAVKTTAKNATKTKQTVKWSSSDKSVAKVSKTGKVTAKGLGKCTITAKIGKKTYKCKIESTYKGACKAIKNAVEDFDSTLEYSQDKRMEKDYRDCSSFVSRCYWDSSLGREIFAIGGEDGKNWAYNAASQASWFASRGSCLATSAISIDQLLPGDIIYYQTNYAGENDEYLHIDHCGLYIGQGKVLNTGGSGGKGTIGYRGTSVDQESNIRFIARPYATGLAAVDSNEINLYLSKVGSHSKKLGASISTSNAYASSFGWSSSNTKVASVSSSGYVKAKKKGSATITATYGEKKFKIKVNVHGKLEKSKKHKHASQGSKKHKQQAHNNKEKED